MVVVMVVQMLLPSMMETETAKIEINGEAVAAIDAIANDEPPA